MEQETEQKIDEKLELTLNELAEDQQRSNQLHTEMIAAVDRLAEEISGFEEQLKNQKVIVPEIDTKPIRDIMNEGLAEVKITINNSLKKIRGNWLKNILEADTKKNTVNLILGCMLLTYLLVYFKDRLH